jgi:hypothetical protein
VFFYLLTGDIMKKVYDPKKVKKQILAEAELHDKFGMKKTVAFCLNEIFNNDVEALYDFLTSDDGGFEEYEVSRTLYKMQHNKKEYNKRKLITGLQAF